MSREIKFRVWDKGCDRMSICGSDVHDSISFIGENACYYNLQNGCGSMPDGMGEYELMQYTGLKDKNGVEVYEGDIVKQEYSVILNTTYDSVSYGFIDQESEEGYHIGEIFITASKGVTMRNPMRYKEDEKPDKTNQYKSVAGYRCEIIGNKYEHPHLLEADD